MFHFEDLAEGTFAQFGEDLVIFLEVVEIVFDEFFALDGDVGMGGVFFGVGWAGRRGVAC